MPTGVAIARQVTAGGFDLVITSSTPSMQAVANNNREGKVKHLFTLVADPFASGVGLDRANPLKHPPYMVGQGSFPPVETAFALAKQMLPGLERIGTAWNPSETNSLIFVERGRKIAKETGLTLLEANADTTSAVGDAVNSLIARGAQAIWVGGDNTVIAGIDQVIAIAKRSSVPVFTILPGAPDRGTLFDAGPDFYQVGRQGGLLAADILEGADIAKIPVRDVLDLVPAFLSVNTTVLKGLREPWRVPDEALARASVVVDETGVHKKAVPAAPPANQAADRKPLSKTWRLSLIELNRVAEVEEGEQGVLDGLKESGLVDGRDYKYTVRNAQGDMATVSGARRRRARRLGPADHLFDADAAGRAAARQASPGRLQLRRRSVRRRRGDERSGSRAERDRRLPARRLRSDAADDSLRTCRTRGCSAPSTRRPK